LRYTETINVLVIIMAIHKSPALARQHWSQNIKSDFGSFTRPNWYGVAALSY